LKNILATPEHVFSSWYDSRMISRDVTYDDLVKNPHAPWGATKHENGIFIISHPCHPEFVEGWMKIIDITACFDPSTGSGQAEFSMTVTVNFDVLRGHRSWFLHATRTAQERPQEKRSFRAGIREWFP
jgi:hypothetical protein